MIKVKKKKSVTKTASGFKLTPTKSPPPPLEYDEQCALFEWAEVAKKKWPCLHWLHSSGNGVRVTPGVAVKMKKSGLKRGIPDVFLPHPVGGKSGLYVELKRRKGGVVSDEQNEFIDYARANSYSAVVAKGWEEARDYIIKYLNGDI